MNNDKNKGIKASKMRNLSSKKYRTATKEIKKKELKEKKRLQVEKY